MKNKIWYIVIALIVIGGFLIISDLTGSRDSGSNGDEMSQEDQWQVSSLSGYVFEFPPNYTLREPGDEGFLLLLASPEAPSEDALISVDYQKTGANASFDEILESTRNELNEPFTEEIGSATVLSGLKGEGDETESVTTAFIKEGDAAIVINMLVDDQEVRNSFNRIVASFALPESEEESEE